MFYLGNFRHLASGINKCTNFLSLSDEESAIMSTLVLVHTSRKKEEIKTTSVLTKLMHSLY